MNTELTEGLYESAQQLHLPRWSELPDFGLYLDQVLGFVDSRLEHYDVQNARKLTASMVNNYVKMGAIPAPVRKKYYRSQLAMLIVICILKPILSIGDIRDLMVAELASENGSALYDGVCEMFERANLSAAGETEEAFRSCETEEAARRALLQSALRACAERSLSQVMLGRLPSRAEK